MSRAERREQDEKCKRTEVVLKAAQEVEDRMAQDEAKRIIERAQLEEEELAVQRRIEQKQKWQEMAKHSNIRLQTKYPIFKCAKIWLHKMLK